jgi:uncharacterized protein YxeA
MKRALCAAVAVLALCVTGCSFAHYEDPTGRKLTVIKCGQDTEIGRLEAATDKESVSLENYNAKQSEVMKELLATTQELLKRLPAMSAMGVIP